MTGLRRVIGLVAAVTATILMAGCGMTATDLPLPGGGLPGPTYEVSAEFTDVLNLPQKAKVTMDGVVIGQVDDISAEGSIATVRIRILKKFPLPKEATWELRQATALGEVFLAVTPPATAEGGSLQPGDLVPLRLTGSAPSIEDTLAALSTLLNGGGLNNLKTILDEINLAFDGRAVPTRRLLRELSKTAAVLHARSRDINRILTSMDQLAQSAVTNTQAIDALLRDVSPAVEVLSEQREQFVTMLRGFERLAATGGQILGETRASAALFARELEPVLDGFIAIDQELAPALNDMLAFHRAFQAATRGSTIAGTIRVDGVQP